MSNTKNIRNIFLAVAAVVFAVAGFTGCGHDSTGTEEELKSVILKHMETTQNEDIEGALKDLDLPQEKLDRNRQVMKEMFEMYDLEYTMVGFKVLKCEGDSAVVEVVMDTKKVSGPEFKDNRSKLVYGMKKESGRWRIIGSKMIEANYLETGK